MHGANFLRMPRSLDGDEIPFVIGFAPDTRQELVIDDTGFRRGGDRFTIEHILDGDFRVRALGWNFGSTICAVASTGPLLEPWWPLLQSFPADPSRPVLSAAAATGKVSMAWMDMEIEVSLFPYLEGIYKSVFAACGINKDESFSDETVALCTQLSMPVIKTALMAISEYPTLVDEVPDVNVGQGDMAAPLDTILEVAAEIAASIAWQHNPRPDPR